MIDYLPLKRITKMHEEEITEAVNRVIRSGWYLSGNEVERFENSYAQYIGTQHCITCANGLDALWLILRAYKELGILQEGDEVIVPANTYIATLLSITENGLRAVLVEPDPNTLQIDDQRIEEAITPRTRAIMIVHLYGRCAFTEKIAKYCQTHQLLLFEDNAQAHGCTFHSQHTGSLGDAAAHSFYPGKNLGAMGDAGAITTNDDTLANMLRTLANYGSPRKYVFTHKGRNSRMDELQAAVLSVKLNYLNTDNLRRKAIAEQYYHRIHHPLIRLPFSAEHDSVFHIFPILSPVRDNLQAYLKANGVQTLIHYPIPPHQQKAYEEWQTLCLPITEAIHREELSLPCHPAMTDKEVEQVIDLINQFSA